MKLINAWPLKNKNYVEVSLKVL